MRTSVGVMNSLTLRLPPGQIRKTPIPAPPRLTDSLSRLRHGHGGQSCGNCSPVSPAALSLLLGATALPRAADARHAGGFHRGGGHAYGPAHVSRNVNVNRNVSRNINRNVNVNRGM